MHHVTHHGVRPLTAGESKNQSRAHSHTNQSTDECDDRRSVLAMQPIRGTLPSMLYSGIMRASECSGLTGNYANIADATLSVRENGSLPAPAISPSARVASAYSCPEEMTRGEPDCATAAVSADNTIVASDATGDDPIILVSSSCSEEPSTCVSSAARSFETVSLLDGNGTACWIFSLMPSKRSCRPAWQPRKQPNPRPHQSPIPRYRFSRKVGMT